jgi:integrase
MLVEKCIKDRFSTETVRKKQRSPVTIHKEMALLSSIFNMAVQEQVTNENPCRFVRKRVRKNLQARNKGDRYLNQYAPDEEQRLFAQFTGRREYLAAIVRFDLETGLGCSELRSLKKEHINLTNIPRFFTINCASVALDRTNFWSSTVRTVSRARAF